MAADVDKVFKALAAPERRLLLDRLRADNGQTLRQLSVHLEMSRQAVTKHLRVLERVRIVHRRSEGRESLFTFDPQPVIEMKEYLVLVSNQWDLALGRLKRFVEDPS